MGDYLKIVEWAVIERVCSAVPGTHVKRAGFVLVESRRASGKSFDNLSWACFRSERVSPLPAGGGFFQPLACGSPSSRSETKVLKQTL